MIVNDCGKRKVIPGKALMWHVTMTFGVAARARCNGPFAESSFSLMDYLQICVRQLHMGA